MAVSKFFPQIIIGTTIGAAALAGFLYTDPEVSQHVNSSESYYLNPVAPLDTPPTLPYPIDPNDGSDPFYDDENN